MRLVQDGVQGEARMLRQRTQQQVMRAKGDCRFGQRMAEPEGAAFKTKAEAEEAEKGLLSRAADAIKDAVGR